MATRNASQWTIHGERILDDTRKAVLSIASVELPDGTRFEQYVLRIPAAIMVIVLNDADEVLMLRRHRFIVDQWVWELPGGYLDPPESPEAAAFREVEEETGWKPREVELLVEFQPMEGIADQRNLVYLARGADRVDGVAPDVNEAEQVAWIPLTNIRDLIRTGEIVGAGAVAGLYALLLDRAERRISES